MQVEQCADSMLTGTRLCMNDIYLISQTVGINYAEGIDDVSEWLWPSELRLHDSAGGLR